MNIDFDILLTVIASGICRLFAKSLRGYERAQARQVFRRFLDTTASVSVSTKMVLVRLHRRSHNPILIDSGLIGSTTVIPWWRRRKLVIETV